MRRWLALIVLAAGCWGARAPASSAPPPSIAAAERSPEPWPSIQRGHVRERGPDRCTEVLAHVFDLARQDVPNSGFTSAMLDEIQESTVESCHETSWSDDILDCYADTSSTAQTTECYRSMSEAQREDFEKRFMDIRLRHRNAPSPPPTP